jgi:DHA1 family bicyclomycin/chloramphenicol resistance-like MFS transporter
MTQTKLRTGLILLIGALGVLQPFSLDPYLANIGFIAEDLKVSNALIAQNLTALTLGVAVGLAVAGPLSDAIGRRRPVLMALTGYIMAAILASTATSVEVFFTGRVLQGFFAACAAIVANAMLRDLYEGLLLIKAMGRSMLLMASSWFIGPIFGSYLQSFTDWRGLGFILATLAAFLLVLIYFKLPDTMSLEARTKSTAKQVAKRFVNLLKDRVFLGVVFIQITINVSLFAYLSVAPFVYDTAYNVTPADVGIFLSINSVGAYLGSQIGAKLSQVIKPQYALLVSLVIGSTAGLGLVFTATMNLGFIAFTSIMAIFTLGFGISSTPVLGLAMAAHPEEAGTAAGLVLVAGTIATTVAGAYYAILDKTSSIGIGITQFAAMGIGIIILFAVVRPKELEIMK